MSFYEKCLFLNFWFASRRRRIKIPLQLRNIFIAIYCMENILSLFFWWLFNAMELPSIFFFIELLRDHWRKNIAQMLWQGWMDLNVNRLSFTHQHVIQLRVLFFDEEKHLNSHVDFHKEALNLCFLIVMLHKHKYVERMLLEYMKNNKRFTVVRACASSGFTIGREM